MTDFDFSNIRKMDVNADTTAEYVWRAIEGEPGIVFAPMVDSNRAYLNETIRLTSERVEKASSNPPVAARDQPKATADRMFEDRNQDRWLLAYTCARGWGEKPPVMADGTVPEFSADAVYAFLKAVPDYLIDPLRSWAQNPFNFVPRKSVVTADQADKLGKP